MNKMKSYLLLLLFLPLSLSVESQTHDPTIVRFVNTGKMHVAANSNNASLFIPDGVLTDKTSSIVQKGVTVIGGNFYQNAETPAFSVEANSFTSGSGTVRFITNHSPKQRRIAVWGGSVGIPVRYTTVNPTVGNFFPRNTAYVAFPHIEIATADTIYIPAMMGLDADNVVRTSSTGTLYLESNPLGSDQIYEASLRITGNTVTAGAVVVEKYVLPFRDKPDANIYLYPFATPYTYQRAGYFAGNWVRAPRADASGHYAYPFADKRDATQDYIEESQYVRWADDLLFSGNPYLLRLQPDGHSYDLPFIMTGGEEHDLEKFILNGKPYNLPFADEQKITGTLFCRAPAASGTKYQWLIGNSYTSAISIDLLISAMKNSSTQFSNLLYIYPHGATSYEAYDLSSDYPGNIPDIPAMSVFMLIVSSGNTNTSQEFIIHREMQIHGKGFDANGTGPFLSPAQSNPQLVFRLTPEDNPYIYDQTRIVLQEGTPLTLNSLSIAKPLNTTGDYFQLYGGSQTNALSKNVLPENTSETPLFINPPKYAISCRLTVSGLETLSAETLLLYDSKLDTWIDLLLSEDYVFESEPQDNPERFKLYFKSPTDLDFVETVSVSASYKDGYLYLTGLNSAALGSRLSIYNTSGLLLQETEIDSYPDYNTSVPVSTGVYVAKIMGEQPAIIKFIKR